MPVVVLREGDESSDDPIKFSHEKLAQAVARLPGTQSRLYPQRDHFSTGGTMLRCVLKVFNKCLMGGIFPRQCKIARFVLLYKGQRKSVTSALSFRLLSLLNGVDKLFKRLILQRLYE